MGSDVQADDRRGGQRSAPPNCRAGAGVGRASRSTGCERRTDAAAHQLLIRQLLMQYRGVILAGGRGTRLGVLTRVTNKHLLPIGPEPMIYCPLRKLVGAGVQDILLISGSEH